MAKQQLAIILGSGIELELPASELIKETPYLQLKNFPAITVAGHKGVLRQIMLDNGCELFVFAGRFHLYEGFKAAEVQVIVRYIKEELGIQNLLITNAAGGVSADLEVADLMMIDSIQDFQNDGNLTAERGLLSALTKPKLPITTQLSELVKQKVEKHGCYAAVLGPNYETQTEIELFRKMGCSAVGMSTYLEVKYALENNLNVAAVSVITNSWFSDEAPSHQEVLDNSKKANTKISKLVLYLSIV